MLCVAIRTSVYALLLSTAMLCLPALGAMAVPSANAAVAAAQAPAQIDPDVPVKFYIVARNAQGETEFLFELAERFLGNGDRYNEIFDLNVGRPQPGGGVLTDPAVIKPGWVLQLPADAEGPNIQSGPLPAADAPVTLTPTPNADTEPSGTPQLSEDSGADASLVPIIVGVLVLLAGVAATMLIIRRQRRRADRGTPFDDSLLRTDTSASWMVDRALRVLIAGAEKAGTPVPRVLGVFIEGRTMRLKLASPASAAPEPWTASEDGQSWSAPIARLQSDAASDASTEAFARLMSIGVAQSGRVFVNVDRARGAISLDGPTGITHEVLRRWLGELTGNPWSDEPRVVMIGDGLPQPEDAEHMANLEQLVPELKTESRGILVLSHAPSSAQQSMLASRFASPNFGWVVIVLTDMSTAKWRFTVSADGILRSGFLPDVRFMDRPPVLRRGQ